MPTYTTEQVKKISNLIKRHLSDKVFSHQSGSYTRFEYKVVPIISRDKYNSHFHFKVVVTKFERHIMLRDENGWVRDAEGGIAREWRKQCGTKLMSHRFNWDLRNRVQFLPILKVFDIQWYDFSRDKIKVEWAV